MADDIVPDLLKAIQKAYRESKEADKALKELRKKLSHGNAKTDDSLAYSRQIGEILSDTYGKLITPEVLPNGQMYYNIATRVIDPTIKEGLEDVSEYHMAVQEDLNEAARIYIKPQKPPINQDRIDGIIERLTGEPFEDISWILGTGVIQNVMQSRIDDHVKADADFHYKSGLKPVIKRTTDGKCCKWCSAHAGTYPYTPDMDREVFRRHANCGCVTAYYPDVNSKKNQNVWDKTWKSGDELEVQSNGAKTEAIKAGMSRRVKETRAEKNQNPIPPKDVITDYGLPHTSYTHNIASDLKYSNENLSKCSTAKEQDLYKTNCQRCVISMEARRRGMDVRALPKTNKNDPLSSNDLDSGWPSVFEKPDFRFLGPITNEKAKKDIRSQMKGYGDGSRAIVRLEWNPSPTGERSAHVFFAEQVNGKTVFIDPQTGETHCESYFDNCIPGSIGIMRVDDKEFNSKLLQCVEGRV